MEVQFGLVFREEGFSLGGAVTFAGGVLLAITTLGSDVRIAVVAFTLPETLKAALPFNTLCFPITTIFKHFAISVLLLPLIMA